MFQKNGYTLFEVVIYTALLALLLATTSSSAISLYRLFGITRVERQIVLEGDVALETIIREIRYASSTNITGSVFGSHPGTLEVGGSRFSLSGATLKWTTDEAVRDLTAKTRVSNLLFYYATSSSPTNSAEIIIVRMTLEAGEGFLARSKNFFGSAVVRGIY